MRDAASTRAPDGDASLRRAAKRARPTMMEQFARAKREQPDSLLFFRMGDFYELFGEDAKVAARELGIALTSRSKGEEALPMAGVPVRSVDGYLMKLVSKGFKVSICEQMQDPRSTKGIVDRAIVRVVTPGTLTEEDALEARANNWLASLALARSGPRNVGAGLAWVDVSTGRMLASEVPLERVEDELSRIAPAELLLAEDAAAAAPELAARIESALGARVSPREPWRFAQEGALRVLKRHFRVATLEGFGFDDASPAVSAAGALVEYLEETSRGTCAHVRRLERVEGRELVVLDRATRSCLELLRTQRDGRHEGSLLHAIDATLTPMGGRMLREWLLAPLREVDAILHRQRGVAELFESPFLREDARELLGGVLDIERLVAKVSTGRAGARDLVALASSLEPVAPLRTKLENVYSKILGELLQALDPLEELVGELRATLVDSPPPALRDGGLVRAGFDPELDRLRGIAGDGKAWMARFQAEEAARTGIQGLKIGFNSVFGYFIEVPRGQVARVPASYARKQTIKAAERYVTPELKRFEDEVLRAEERARDMEYEIFLTLRARVADAAARILDTARALAEIDVLAALAQTAAENRYVAPTIHAGETLRIEEGRHPVIERTQTDEPFVPNDTLLDRGAHLIGVITGPNLAGKSTFIRQTALIVLLAQTGSFVPARAAEIGVVDRVFTRIGSADDIGRGASTFMVEMVEIASILNNAGPRSLLVLDEVGRGTSTFDGLALAWAILEHVHETIRARTLFATHYHQLTGLAEKLTGVFNLNVAVREWEDQIVFLHKIVEGGTDRSYGIHVARLAGVPEPLLARAKQILGELEGEAAELAPRAPTPGGGADGERQLGLFDASARRSGVEEALREIDVEKLTPLQALLELAELRALLEPPA